MSEFPEQFYCNSGVQIRAKLLASVPNAAELLQATGYCIEESIAEATFPYGCVIRSDKYEWIACPNGLPGLKFNWVDSSGQATEQATLDAQRALAGTEIQLRYNSLSSN